MRPDITKAFNRITDMMWPGVVTVPTMAVGGSDGRYLRVAGIPTYGVQGFFLDRDDVRAHGRDERMLVNFWSPKTADTCWHFPAPVVVRLHISPCWFIHRKNLIRLHIP